ncbi:MAG: MFS transporter [Candidatus Limnocylindria bacterium]
MTALTADMTSVVRRNTFLLAAYLAFNWAVIQLTMSVASITMERLTGVPELVGIAPAVAILALGAATIPAGRYMDRHGRVPGIAIGFLGALAGAVVTYVGVLLGQPLLFLAGLALVGGGAGVVNLARTGAADMYPPERRAAGVGLVLFGAAVGSLAAPFLFGPLLRSGGGDALLLPWLVAAALLALGAGLTRLIRIDPLAIARAMRTPAQQAAPVAAARPLREIFARPAPRAAAVAVIGAQVVMASLMALVGVEMHHRGHELTEISAALGAHFVGMFGLAPVAGRVVDRLGRQRSLLLGLALLGLAAASLSYAASVLALAVAMLGLGVGWNLAFVAGTVLLADATAPNERGRALGALDLANAVGSASGAALLGALLGAIGFTAVVAVALVILAGPFVFVMGGVRRPEAEIARA